MPFDDLASIEDIQRDNLETLIIEHFSSSRAAFAQAVGVKKGIFDKVFANPNKSGYKPIGHANLRKVELALELPLGWIDTPLAFQDGRCGIMAVRDRRRFNVRTLIDQHFEGSPAACARAVGEEIVNITRPLNIESKWVKHFGTALIRRIESRLGLPANFLDHPHSLKTLSVAPFLVGTH